MAEKYRSLENRIREVQRDAVLKKMEEAALKRGRITAKAAEPPKTIEEEVQPVDEISKETLQSYVDKSHSPGEHEGSVKSLHNNAILNNFLGDKEKVKKAQHKIQNRYKYNFRAVDKIAKEEVEPVDEISKEKLSNYVKGAAQNMSDLKAIGAAAAKTHPEAAKAHYKTAAKRKAGIDKAVDKLYKEEAPTPPEEVKLDPIEELAPAQNPLQQKLAAQRDQLQKQKEQIRLQIAQQKAAKQEQIMKQKGEKELQKVKEGEEGVDEAYRIRTFRSANRLQQLHQSRIQQLSRQGDPRARRLIALHRQRAMELKRIAYSARDNPEKLPLH